MTRIGSSTNGTTSRDRTNYFEGESERQWQLFDRDDRWIGEVATELDFDPHHARGDQVLGVLTDEMGLQRVARFSLRPVE